MLSAQCFSRCATGNSASRSFAAERASRARAVSSASIHSGSVQTVMPLSEGRAIKLTTSRYFTPSGVSIQGLGIAPDVDLPVGDPGAALLQAVQLLKNDPVLQTSLH
jgi:C-terminal processing protease CtpA/Prc